MPTSKTIPKKLPSWINIVFARFAIIYQGKWALDDDALLHAMKWEWATTQGLEHMTTALADATVERCKAESSWPPTPHEFKKTLLVIKAEKAREEERKRLASSLPMPPDPIQMRMQKRARHYAKLKKENPHLSWFEIAGLPSSNPTTDRK